MASFREINYAVRPAKSVERKMMAEGYRRLELGWPLASYRYVGMGSVYFADFQLFHQALGIDDMISIEREEQYRPRFEFNRPFACVNIIFGEASTVLGSLTWDKRTLVWLDYDGKISSSVISDLKAVIQKAPSGSLVSLSINVEADRPPQDLDSGAEQDTWRLSEFEKAVGASSMPPELSGEELRGKKYPSACWQVLKNAVGDQLIKRNGRSDLRPDSMIAKQVFHFKYADGVPMLTVGWLLYSHDEAHKADLCAMSGSVFREAEDPFVIEAPKLTPKEIRHLNASLPSGPPIRPQTISELKRTTGITESDIAKFASVYRFYPQFSEVAL